MKVCTFVQCGVDLDSVALLLFGSIFAGKHISLCRAFSFCKQMVTSFSLNIFLSSLFRNGDTSLLDTPKIQKFFTAPLLREKRKKHSEKSLAQSKLVHAENTNATKKECWDYYTNAFCITYRFQFFQFHFNDKRNDSSCSCQN